MRPALVSLLVLPLQFGFAQAVASCDLEPPEMQKQRSQGWALFQRFSSTSQLSFDETLVEGPHLERATQHASKVAEWKNAEDAAKQTLHAVAQFESSNATVNATKHTNMTTAYNKTITGTLNNENRTLCRSCVKAEHRLINNLALARDEHAQAQMLSLVLATATKNHEASSADFNHRNKEFQKIKQELKDKQVKITYTASKAEFEDIVATANKLHPAAVKVTKAEKDMMMHQDEEKRTQEKYNIAAKRAKDADELVAADQREEEKACAGIGLPPLPAVPAVPAVKSSIPPGKLHLFYAIEGKRGWGAHYMSQGMFQLLSLDENRNVLAWIDGRVYRLEIAANGSVVPKELSTPPWTFSGISYNPKTGDLYGPSDAHKDKKKYLTAEDTAHMKKIESKTGFPFPTGNWFCVLKRARGGTVSAEMGMCNGFPGRSMCWPAAEGGSSRHCGAGSQPEKFGQLYYDRLAEINPGVVDVDPKADISMPAYIPRAVIVDPDTNDVYVSDEAGNSWPSRWVVWKLEAATQRARIVAGRFNSDKLTGKNYGQMSGFGQPATAAHLGTIYAIALQPITKELHVVGYPGNIGRVDANGNLQAVDCTRCKHTEVSAITYHKREKQWIVMGGNHVFWQNGTTIAGTNERRYHRFPSYKEDPGPWNPTEKWLTAWGGNMVLDEATNELYIVHSGQEGQPQYHPAIYVINLSPA